MKSQRPNSPMKYNTGPIKSNNQDISTPSTPSASSAQNVEVIKQAIVAVQSIVVQGLSTIQSIVALNERQNPPSTNPSSTNLPTTNPPSTKPKPPPPRKQSICLASKHPPLKSNISQEQKCSENSTDITTRKTSVSQDQSSVYEEQGRASISEEHSYHRRTLSEDIVADERQDGEGRPSISEDVPINSSEYITSKTELSENATSYQKVRPHENATSQENMTSYQKPENVTSHENTTSYQKSGSQENIASYQRMGSSEDAMSKTFKNSEEMRYVENLQKSVDGIISKTEEILSQNRLRNPI